MKEKAHEIALRNNNDVKISIISGHFATNHSHVNYYVDLTRIKTNHKVAKEAGKEIASVYNMSKMIDTIVCLEGTEMLGAFVAYYLAEAGSGINAHKEISVITPELNMNNQLIFRDNIQEMIENKHILLLMSSVSTGKTIRRSAECINYYNGIVEGAAAIFSAVDHIDGIEINSLFHTDDMPQYETELPSHCRMCAENKKVDAIINSYGYSKI